MFAMYRAGARRIETCMCDSFSVCKQIEEEVSYLHAACFLDEDCLRFIFDVPWP